MDSRPWGPIDPNSGHQRWSRWTALVIASPARVPTKVAVEVNWAKYCARLFASTVAQAKVDYIQVRERRRPQQVKTHAFLLACIVEGPPVHDPEYRARIEREISGVFVARGFGPSARVDAFDAVLLAGSAEDGRPAAQLLVMPRVQFDPQTGLGRVVSEAVAH